MLKSLMLRRFVKDESGQVLVLTLLTMTILMAMLALAIDVGILFRERRVAQTAADAGAMAGALEWHTNGSGNVTSVAQTAASNNGITNVTTNVHVNLGSNIVNAYHDTAGYVEVIVSQPTSTYFMNMFGFSMLNVTAKGVAGITPGPSCIIQLDKNKDDNALWIKGNTTINTPNCGIQVNSTGTGAFCDQGNAKIDGPYVRVSGNQASGGKCGKNSGAPLFSNAPQVNDPYAALPDPASLCNGSNTTNVTSVTSANVSTIMALGTVYPTGGVGGPGATVTCFSGTNVNLNNVTMGNSYGSGSSTYAADSNSSLFVFLGGVSMTGTVNIYGTLALGANTTVGGPAGGGTFNQGTATLNVIAPGADNSPNAPLGDLYNSIGLEQSASNTAGACQDPSGNKAMVSSETSCLQTQFGSGAGQLSGVIYAPDAMVYLQDQGGSIGAAGVVSYTMYVNSQLSINNSYFTQNAASSPLSTIQLVE